MGHCELKFSMFAGKRGDTDKCPTSDLAARNVSLEGEVSQPHLKGQSLNNLERGASL